MYNGLCTTFGFNKRGNFGTLPVRFNSSSSSSNHGPETKQRPPGSVPPNRMTLLFVAEYVLIFTLATWFVKIVESCWPVGSNLGLVLFTFGCILSTVALHTYGKKCGRYLAIRLLYLKIYLQSSMPATWKEPGPDMKKRCQETTSAGSYALLSSLSDSD